MQRDYMECNEVAGKTIKALKIYDGAVGGGEMLVEFTDGTSFSCSVNHQTTVKALLFQGGTGIPRIIQDYNV